MDIIDKVSSVAHEQKWRAQYLKQVDGMVDSPSEIYPESVCYYLKWQVLFAGALHPKVAGSGDINTQDSYKAFRKMIKKARQKGVKEKTYLQSRTTAVLTAQPEKFLVAEGMSLREKSTNYGALLGDGLLGWRFVTTVSWSCSVVPKDVRVGGVVFILVEVMYRSR